MKQLVERVAVIAIVCAPVGLLLSDVRAADRGPYEVVVERDSGAGGRYPSELCGRTVFTVAVFVVLTLVSTTVS